MDLEFFSFSTLVPQVSYHVIYSLNCLALWMFYTIDMGIASTLIWYYAQAQLYAGREADADRLLYQYILTPTLCLQ